MALRDDFRADAGAILKEVGFPVRSGSRTGFGRHAQEVIEISGGGGYPGNLAERETLTVRRADFALAIGDTVELELTPGTWTAYKVANRMPAVSGPYSGVLHKYVLEDG